MREFQQERFLKKNAECLRNRLHAQVIAYMFSLLVGAMACMRYMPFVLRRLPA